MSDIKEMTEKAEIEQYAITPPSGRGTGNIELSLDSILPNIKSISLRKPFAMIVGSMATQGKSNNDIDIVVRGEDLSDKVKDAINFRLYRLFTDIIKCAYDDVSKYIHIHYNNAGSYTSYVPLYELNLVPVNHFETINMSKIPFALRGNINLINKSGNQRIIAGYANVAIVDSDEQFIPVETLKSGINSLLSDSHYSNLMLVHQNIQIGKIIPKFGEYTTHVDDKGLFIVAEIRQDLEIASEIWKNILDGQIHGFSIGCEVISSHKSCNEDKCVTVLDKINIFEVSICTKPVNEESGFVIISKSKIDDVCGECILNIDKMKETIVKSEEKPTENKSPDQIAELQKRIDSLEAKINEAKNPEEPIPEEPKKEPPKEEPKKPEDSNYPYPEEMALFMLDFIITNPKASAQDIAKAWIESKKKKPEQPIPEPPKEEPKPVPPKENYPSPEPSKYPYPEKMDDLMDKLSSAIDKLTKLSAEDELKLAIKARDDQISALQTQIKTLSKPEEPTQEAKPKTIQNTESKDIEIDRPIKVEHGEVYFKD